MVHSNFHQLSPKNKPIIKKCKNCGKEFELKLGRGGQTQYCSEACQKKHYYEKHVRDDFKHGKIWVLTPCDPEDPDPEKMEFDDGQFFKWVKEVRK